MNSSPSKLAAGPVVFLIVATLAGIFAIARPENLHRMTVEAYTRGPLRRIKPLAEYHTSNHGVRRIRIGGFMILAIVAWVTILIVRNN